MALPPDNITRDVCLMHTRKRTLLVPKIKAAACNDSPHQLLISESNFALNLSIQTVYMHIYPSLPLKVNKTVGIYNSLTV